MSPLFSQMSPLFLEPWDIVPSYEISRQNTAIIPGPVDHNVTDPITRKINSYLQESLSNEFKFKFTFSYKPLLMLEKSEENFMLFGDGGLHLNIVGTNKLRFFFLRVISTLSV